VHVGTIRRHLHDRLRHDVALVALVGLVMHSRGDR
jgi:hypothetical protein